MTGREALRLPPWLPFARVNAYASWGCAAGAFTSYGCQHLSYDVSVEHRYEWVSIGSYVGAGVLGAAGLATWFFWPRAPARVTALVDGRRVGLGLEGRW